LNILICANDRPGHYATGPNAWLQRLVKDLVTNHGLNITTVFLYKGKLKDCPTITYFKSEGLPISLLKEKNLPYVADQVLALLKIVKDLDITVVIANLLVPAYYATPYLKKAHIPVIGVMHSNDAFYRGVIEKFIKGKTENQLTVSVSVSEFIDKLSHNKSSNTQLEIIPCGTPVPQIKASHDETEVLEVVYAGRLEVEQKQILKLTKAFCDAAIQDSRLRFSIYGSGTAQIDVEKIIKEKSKSNVNYMGAVKPSDILNCLRKHQVFTLMSDYEGMPVALMEAMACGVIPVCLEESSGVNEIIEHGVNGFIVKNRTQDYLKHLQLLLDKPELQRTLSQNAIKTIEEKYSSFITHQRWITLLRRFNNQTVKPLRVPNRIRLSGNLLHYGDNRKPSLKEQALRQISDNWLKIRLYVRPRARLRTFLGYEEKP